MRSPVAFVLVILTVTLHAQMQVSQSFGINGQLNFVIDTFNEPVSIQKLTGDTLVLLANVTGHAAKTDIALVKLTPQGAYVNSYGNNGIARYDFNGMDVSTAVSCVAMKNGTAMILGKGYNNNTQYQPACLIKLNAHGKVDSLFGNNGTLNLQFAGLEEFPKVLKQDSKGMILLGGFSNDSIHLRSDVPVIARLDEHGILDADFGINGKAYLRFPNSIIDASRHIVGGVLYDLLPMPDGSLLACGGYSDGNSLVSFITRLTNKGDIDTTFFNKGYLAYNFTPFNNNQVVKMAMAADGLLWFGATSNTPQGRDFYFGNADVTTGDFNISQIDFDGNEDVFADIQFNNKGEPVLIGKSINISNNTTWYQGDYVAVVNLQSAHSLVAADKFLFNTGNNVQCGAVGSVLNADGSLICYGFNHNTQGGSELMLVAIENQTNTTGMEHVMTESGLKVYPNPAHNTLVINNTGETDATYTLYDLQGRVIALGAVLKNSDVTIDLGTIPRGIYACAFGSNMGFTTRRVIVE